MKLHIFPAPGCARDPSGTHLDFSAPASLKVVLVYDNPSAGLRALRKFKSLLRDSYPEVELELAAWQLDRLADPDWFESAVADAATADLLVLATAGTGIPPAGEPWLESCLASRPDHIITLLAFFGKDDPWTISIEGKLPPPAMQLSRLEPRACAAAPQREHPFAA